MSDPNLPPPPPGTPPTPGPPPGGNQGGPPGPPPPGAGGYGAPGGGQWNQPPAQPYVPGSPGGGYGGFGVAPADPGKRLVARLIDFGILVVVWIGVWILMAALVFADAASSTSAVDDLNRGANVSSLFISLALWVLYWLYESLMASTRGQTLGKMIMGLRITDASGNNLTTAAAMKRSAVWLVPIIPCCIGFIGFLVIQIWGLVNIFNRPDRLTLMDQFADSTVTNA